MMADSPPGKKPLHAKDVGVGEIEDVDVVAKVRSVARLVVVSEDMHRGAVQAGVDRDGDDVGLDGMGLADRRVFACSSDIEIAEDAMADAVGSHSRG